MTVPALEIRELKFRYGPSSSWVLDIPKLTLETGEQLLLRGQSGGGKSTLLYLIAGLMEPVKGEIHVSGQNIHQLRGQRRDLFRGRKIGMIFQTFNLLEGFTAFENVMAALMFSDIKQSQHRKHAQTLLESLGIERPGQLVEHMSVGQQQRVAVARAMACKPVLVLADEPTASLDPENAVAAMDLIQQTCAAHGAALLCTSHDPALRERFKRQVHLAGAAPATP